MLFEAFHPVVAAHNFSQKWQARNFVFVSVSVSMSVLCLCLSVSMSLWASCVSNWYNIWLVARLVVERHMYILLTLVDR